MLQLDILKARLKEKLLFDSHVFKFLLGWGCIVSAHFALASQKQDLAFKLFSTAHRGNLSQSSSRYVENLFFRIFNEPDLPVSLRRLKSVIVGYPGNLVIPDNLQRYIKDPAKLLRGNILVLKSPGENEKGVLYLYYSYVYPLFLRLFNAIEIEKRYNIVVEPSWSGYCDLNILCLTSLKNKVVVGSIEPYDSNFIKSTHSNLTVAEFSGNTWVDSAKFYPKTGVEKEFDLIYIASWGSYKRHWALFESLKKVKAQGRIIKVVLVGYPIDLTADRIRALANYYGVLDQITIYENINAGEINELLNRSRVNLLWSRKEGVNRAIIEGMMANVPCIVRKGFNYGHCYHYINEKTGRFADEDEFPRVLMGMLDNLNAFSPRAYVESRMTPEVATRNISEKLQEIAASENSNWSRDIVVRTSSLQGLSYKDEENWDRFEPDSLYLESQMRSVAR